jgi:molybdopterin-guanine dinucleotide biosynthesis protein A
VPVETAGVVLVGGHSARMGSPKGDLEWHGSTLLRRTTGVVARAVGGPVIVVRAAGQALPELAPGVEVHDDPREGRGPLQGLAVGLRAAASRAEVAFVCAVDLPFLHAAFVRAVLDALADDIDVALPVAREHEQPLAAAYRTNLAGQAEQLVAEDRLRLTGLLDGCRVARLDAAALGAYPGVAALDPGLESLVNVNGPHDYRLARAAPAPEIRVESVGQPGVEGSGTRTVRAATLAGAVQALALPQDPQPGVLLNGMEVGWDAQLPLLGGDTLSLTWLDGPLPSKRP